MPITPVGGAILIASAALPGMSTAADYQTQVVKQEGMEVVRLIDVRHRIEVSIVPSIGNMAVSMKVKDHEILYMPSRSLAELKADQLFGGIPFLAPWANRIVGNSYWANGKKYLLNLELGNLRLDQNRQPIHGLLAFSSLWTVVAMEADSHSARVTSRLEFWKYSDLMAQFPFPHTIEMTYRLQNGTLEIETLLHNDGSEPMPVAVGFHPYLQVDDAPRESWTAHLPVREHLVLDDRLTPTGELKPMDLADPFPLRGAKLDDGFLGLIRNGSKQADFWVRGKAQQITVSYGPKYTVAVAYAPVGGNFICFEPMSALTNGFNLARDGKWDGLQSVAPGGEWRESFKITPKWF